LLAFVVIVWKMIPERKWVKKFDLATKLLIVDKPKHHKYSHQASQNEAAANQEIVAAAPKPNLTKKSIEEGSTLVFSNPAVECV
jgi:hypothetical protein